MGMVWRTAVAFRNIFSALFALFVGIASDTLSDMSRTGSAMLDILAIAVSEASVNPLFAFLASGLVAALGIFFYRFFRDSVRSAVTTLIIALVIFIVAALISIAV